jgi:hypothetical protein
MPSIYELMLGLGGFGISAAIYIFAIMVLDFTPRYLDDEHTLGQNNKEKSITE